MENAKDSSAASNKNAFLSVCALPLIWLWNFKVGDYAFWNPQQPSISFAMIFTAIWCFSTAGALGFLAYLRKKKLNWQFGKFLPFYSLALGLIIGFASQAPTLPFPGLGIVSVLIGINYGLLFFQWAYYFGRNRDRSYFFVGGLSLLLLATIYMLLQATHIWEYRILAVILPLGSFATSMLAHYQNSLDNNQTPIGDPQPHRTTQRRLLPFLTILAGFVGSVIVQSSLSIGTSFNTLEYALGAAGTGLLILLVSKKLENHVATSYIMLFGVVSAVISVSILLSLILQIGAVSFGMTTISMVGFWLLFAYIMSLLNTNRNSFRFNDDPLSSFTFGLAIFYGSIAITKLLCLALSAYGQANLTLSAIILACSASMAFYIGIRNGLITSEHVSNSDAFETSCQFIAEQSGLTKRELEVMVLLAKGNSLNHIADTLFLSPNTVKTYRSSMYRKLNVHTRQDLINLICEDKKVSSGKDAE